MIVRPESNFDIAAVRSVQEAAFHRAREADLVDRLRADNDAVLSLVAVKGGQVVGHIVLSRMQAPFRALGLGPIAVMPEHQRKGVGFQLIKASIAKAKSAEWDAIFVLGAPAYYQRFGFDPKKAAGFSSVYAGPHFMILPLQDELLPQKTGEIAYPPAFGALGC